MLDAGDLDVLIPARDRPAALSATLSGPAAQRQYLLERAERRFALYLDDDVWLDPAALETLLAAIDELKCGFVGFAVQGPSYLADERPHELVAYEERPGGVVPERVRRGSPARQRFRLHDAADAVHLARRAGDGRPWWPYQVAWIGGCVPYDRERLVERGGFGFWRSVPPGEDVVAQPRVMERYGGAGPLPGPACQPKLPTTVTDRTAEPYEGLP